ncbi:T9SS type A sorting domain-containing protein [Cryomorphaceae bacterium 1068]|nr:T9SS type A sorting domain-containing protein [Cryomorphaceae bacterium 1068]
MKKSLLPLAFLALGTAASAQVENGDFENWNKLILFEQPFMSFDAISSNYEIFVETGETNVVQVEHEDGSAIRLENIEIGDEVTPAFYILGGTPDQVGEDLVFPGGIPASDPNVTGFSVDMSYDFPGEASGFVIVQFKMNGTPVGTGNMGVGTFFFPVSGQQDWETEVFDFGTTLDAQYNQVVFGFATADLIGSDSDFPVGSWMEIDNLSFINSSDEIPNGSFDVWAQVPAVFYPVKVDVEIDLLNPTYIQSFDAADGQNALGLVTRDFDGFAEPSKAMIGTAETEGGIPTIDLIEEHSMLSFDYKYLADDDIAEAVITFYQQSGESLIPVYGKVIDLEPTDVYESVEYPFLDELEENFVTANKVSIEFVSSKESGNPEPNSLLLLDNVDISGTLRASTIVKHFEPYQIIAYPNPTVGRVTLDMQGVKTGFYRVYNTQGFQIDMVSFKQKQKVTYDLFGMPSGQYTFRFYHENGTRIARVIKN